MHNCNILITMAQSEQLVLQAVLHPTFIHMVFVACDTGVLYGSIFSVWKHIQCMYDSHEENNGFFQKHQSMSQVTHGSILMTFYNFLRCRTQGRSTASIGNKF